MAAAPRQLSRHSDSLSPTQTDGVERCGRRVIRTRLCVAGLRLHHLPLACMLLSLSGCLQGRELVSVHRSKVLIA